MDNQTSDTLGETLVEKGFAPNLYLLDINHALSVPRDFPLPAPWNRGPVRECSKTYALMTAVRDAGRVYSFAGR